MSRDQFSICEVEQRLGEDGTKLRKKELEMSLRWLLYPLLMNNGEYGTETLHKTEHWKFNAPIYFYLG